MVVPENDVTDEARIDNRTALREPGLRMAETVGGGAGSRKQLTNVKNPEN